MSIPVLRSSASGLARGLTFAALLLVAGPGAGADEACYRPQELRADAEAKFAAFLEKAAVICSGVLDSPAMEAWNGFRQAPEMAAGLARADAVRADFYRRLYAGGEWKKRWQKEESEVLDYGSYVMLKSDFDVAGCARLTERLTDFKSGGWPAYGAAVDRVLAAMRPAARQCDG